MLTALDVHHVLTSPEFSGLASGLRRWPSDAATGCRKARHNQQQAATSTPKHRMKRTKTSPTE